MFSTNSKGICIMKNVYEVCPKFENEKYLLRYVKMDDCLDLLKVYSDKDSVPYFNSDNCGGDDFYYTSKERMKQAVEYWFWEYSRQGFVRWSVLDKKSDEVIGTIELFHRESNDYFTNCGLLRLDLRSDYEKAKDIENILSLIIIPTFTLFDCDKIATKAIPKAAKRIEALNKCGFKSSDEVLIGHDGTKYTDYYVLLK